MGLGHAQQLCTALHATPAILLATQYYAEQEHLQAMAGSQSVPAPSMQGQAANMASTAANLGSCLSPAAGHHFDLLMGSVFQQLCVKGWHASSLATMFPNGVLASTSSQQA